MCLHTSVRDNTDTDRLQLTTSTLNICNKQYMTTFHEEEEEEDFAQTEEVRCMGAHPLSDTLRVKPD